MLTIVAGIFLILGSHQSTVDVPPGFTVVEYWEKWVGNEAEQMRIIVDDFNRTVGRDKNLCPLYVDDRHRSEDADFDRRRRSAGYHRHMGYADRAIRGHRRRRAAR